MHLTLCILISNNHFTWGSEVKTSLAPLEVVISLDHTNSVLEPGLDHVAHRGDGVLLRMILQYVIYLTVWLIPTNRATFNQYTECNCAEMYLPKISTRSLMLTARR